MAYQLSVCKSFIVGEINPDDKVHAFQEDHDANEKVLGDSVYGLMDSIHFEMAMRTDLMPSGMMVVSQAGVQEMKKLPGDHGHRVVRRIKDEREALYTGVPIKDEVVSPSRKVIRT